MLLFSICFKRSVEITKLRHAGLGRISASTLVISGSRLEDIRHGGHLSNIDSVDAFNQAVDNFLESIAQEHRS